MSDRMFWKARTLGSSCSGSRDSSEVGGSEVKDIPHATSWRGPLSRRRKSVVAPGEGISKLALRQPSLEFEKGAVGEERSSCREEVYEPMIWVSALS